MGRQRSQIETVERQIAVVDHDIGVLLAELGMHILALRQPVVARDTVGAYQRLAKEKSVLDDYDARILHMQQLGQSLQDANVRIAQLKELLANQEKALRLVYGRVGVIAWEEALSGALSDVIRKVLPDIDQMQQRAAALRQNKEIVSQKSRESSSLFRLPLKLQELIATRKLDRFARGHEEFFVQTGQIITTQASIRHLQSKAAVDLDNSYHTLNREIAVWREEMALLQQRISEDKTSLEEVGVAGSVERKIIELQNLRNSQAESVNRLAIEYGRMICALDNPWTSIDVNAETLRCYDQIRRHQRIRLQLEKRIGDLQIEQQIGELIFLIEEDEERIGHLRQLIDQNNRQIEEIQKNIVQRREQIVEMKHNLAKSLEREEL
jgi:hypothetical protein